MLRVTIELIPFGEDNLTEVIGELCIANTGGNLEVADYELAGYLLNYGFDPDETNIVARTLKNFRRDAGAIELLRSILSEDAEELHHLTLASDLLRKTKLLQTKEKGSE